LIVSTWRQSWTASRDARLYRAVLRLYPRTFRREFAPQMLLDFIEARADAASVGVWTFRAHMGRDLAASLLVEWFRTGLPVIVLIATTIPLIGVSALLRIVDRIPAVSIPATVDRDLLVLELFIVVFLLVVAATIVFATWYMRGVAHRAPPRRRP